MNQVGIKQNGISRNNKTYHGYRAFTLKFMKTTTNILGISDIDLKIITIITHLCEKDKLSLKKGLVI